MARPRRAARWLFLLAFVLAPVWAARAEVKFVPLLDASFALSGAAYTQDGSSAVIDPQGNTLPNTQGTSSGDLYVSFAPNLALTEIPGLWLTPAVEFEYSGANNLINLNDEAFLFSRRLDFYYLLGCNYDFDPVWSVKLKGFGRIENVAETVEESLDNGLYSYRDAGGWAEGSARYEFYLPMRTRAGAKAYQRRYPYYSNSAFVAQYEQTVGPWPAGIPRDLRQEDYNDVETWLRQEISWGPWPVLTNVEVRFKRLAYTQMPVIAEDGTFSAALRSDTYLDLAVELPFQVHPYHQFEIDYAYRLRRSDQNFYDMNEKVFLGGYYDYYRNNLRFLYNLTLPWDITGFMGKCSLAVGVDNRQYLVRPARQQTSPGDAVGAYNYADLHRETNVDLGLTLRQQLYVKWFNLFISAHYITQTSNTNVNDNAPYNYRYATGTLGTAFSF